MLISIGLYQGGASQTNSVVWHKASILPSEGKTPYVNFWSKLRIEFKHYLNLRNTQKATKPRNKSTLSCLNVLVPVLPNLSELF